MTRFIVLSLAFLGWGFYELSGGADFKPGSYTNTLADPPEVELVARADTSGAALTALASETTEPVSKTDPPMPDVTLASVDREVPAPEPVDANEFAAQTVDAEKLAALVAEGISAAETEADIAVGVEAAVEPQETAVLFSMDDLNPNRAALRSDLREVNGSRVNLRSGPGTSYGVVSKLGRGDQVVVLADTGDGWLKLQVVETNRIGWMADFLVTASAN